jgi:hypothetical protein
MSASSPLATPALSETASPTTGTPRRSYSKNGLTNSGLATPVNNDSITSALQPVSATGNQATTTTTAGTDTSASSGKKTVSLRLDINLEIDVRIIAKVHGDVTLSLLYAVFYSCFFLFANQAVGVSA